MRRVPLAPALFALFALLALPAGCQDFAAFVQHGDRTDNALLLELLRSPDLSTAVTAARALGGRPDPYVADILERLLEDGAGQRGSQRELVLRVLLSSVFAAEEPRLGQRLETNREGLASLAVRLEELTPSLQREVLRLLALYPQGAHPGTLMVLGRDLSEQLRGQEGRLTAEQAALLVGYLEAAEALGNADFAPVALAILERTREPSVARAARRTARHLLAANP